MDASEESIDVWRDLVDRLSASGVTYLTGGSAWDGSVSLHTDEDSAELLSLLEDLARAPEARLRNALVALLLRHPRYALAARCVAEDLSGDDPTRRVLLISVVVAAALQSEWSFSLDLYVLDRSRIEGGDLAAELCLPPPERDFGRPCLAAVANLLRATDSNPFNYEADWEGMVHRLLAQLKGESRTYGT